MWRSRYPLKPKVKQTNKNILHVPYKGQALLLPDLISGNINMAVLFYPVVDSFVKSGQLIPIAVDAASRLAELPNTPTFSEAGIPELNRHSWMMLLSNQTNNVDEVTKIRQLLINLLNDPTQSKQLQSATGLIINKKTMVPKPNFLQDEKVRITPVIMQVDH